MKPMLVAIAALLICFPASAQHEWGAKIEGGVSKVTTESYVPMNASETSKYFIMPSANAGIFYNYHKDDFSTFGAELLVSQIEELTKIEYTSTWSGAPYSYKGNIQTHITYISIPFYYMAKLNKVRLSVGFQPSAVVAITSTFSGTEIYSGQQDEVYRKHHGTRRNGKDRFDFGAKAGIGYVLSDKLALDATYYHSINNTRNVPKDLTYSTIQQFVLGIRYTFCSPLERPEVE